MLSKQARLSLDTRKVVWFHNGGWIPQTHRFQLANNIREHLRHNKKRDHEEVLWFSIYEKMLLRGETIKVNHLSFRFVP